MVKSLWKTIWQFLINVSITPVFGASSSAPGCFPKRNESICSKMTFSRILRVDLFIIANNWKQPKCHLVGYWVKKFWYIHLMEYYSVMKRKESCKVMWMALTDASEMLDAVWMSPFTLSSRTCKAGLRGGKTWNNGSVLWVWAVVVLNWEEALGSFLKW